MDDFGSGLLKTLEDSGSNYDIDRIMQALEFAAKAHEGQKRKSGEPYIFHPIEVAKILVAYDCDTDSIIAALLHDTVEDTEVTLDQVKKLFGQEVASLVDGLTKLGKIYFSSQEEQQIENLRKMLLAMAKDIRVILIKLADRLHNMRTLDGQPDKRRREIALETIEVYAPLAHRLGIQNLKSELEDISLRYLDPVGYAEIAQDLKAFHSDNHIFEEIHVQIEEKLKQAGIKARVSGRIKHAYSIYRKMFGQNKRFDEIYDLYAFRIIVDKVSDCYNALGYMHDTFRAMPGRLKDYIATPKPNMYQSLHTTLIGPSGQPFEIQIRTFEMHKTAEYGIAAHWKYKEDPNGKNIETNEEAKLTWLRQILEWQKDMSDNKEFMSLLKNDLDLFSESVYCFTPAGDVKNLPNGSTPIDFAYSIHSAVGNKMVGARVNGKLVTIDYRIQNGDRIEIITSQNSRGPSRDWLNVVKSTQAKNKINQWFKLQYKEDNIIRGKEQMAQYCKTKSIVLSDILKPEYMEKVLRKYGFRDWDAVLAAVGHGGLKEGQVINKLVEEDNKKKKKAITDTQVLKNISEGKKGTEPKALKKTKSGIVVRGIDDVAVRFSKCCNPVPGDEIVGFVTRGRGVSIHRTDCINIINISEEDRARLLDAEWLAAPDQLTGGTYKAEINIYVEDRVGVLVEVAKVFTENEINVTAMASRSGKNNTATINVTIDIHSVSQLNKVIDKLRNLECVYDIQRTTGG